MVFYKDSDDLFHIGKCIVPAGMCALKQYNPTTITIYAVATSMELMPATDVTLLEREDGSTYPDMATFMAENGSFFIG